MTLLDRWRRTTRGAIALYAAAMAAGLFAAAATLDLAAAARAGKAAEARIEISAESALTRYAKNGDKAAALAFLAQTIKAAMAEAYLTPTQTHMAILNGAADGVRVEVRIAAKASTRWLRWLGVATLPTRLTVNREARRERDLLLTLLIDASAGTQGVIDMLAALTPRLGPALRAEMAKNGETFRRVKARIRFFRDLRIAEDAPAWRESSIFDLDRVADRRAMTQFISAERASGGGAVHSGLAALANAVGSLTALDMADGRYAHLIVLWTNAPGAPLSQTDAGGEALLPPGAQDDITVALWKTAGALDQRPRGAGAPPPPFLPAYNEADYLPRGSIDTYGCCASLADLEGEWRRRQTVDRLDMRLIMIAPVLAWPWSRLSRWPNAQLNKLRNLTPRDAIGILSRSGAAD